MNALKLVGNYGVANLKNEFIEEYGDYSEDYPLVNPIGDATNFNWYYLFTVVSFIGMIISFVVANGKKKDKNNKTVENKINPTLKTFLNIIGFSLLIIMIVTGVLGSIQYFNYIKEYNQWYMELPNNAKGLLASINGFTNILNSK